MMKSTRILAGVLSVLLLVVGISTVAVAADGEAGHSFRDAKQGIKDAGHSIGNGFKKVGHQIGDGVRKGVHTVKSKVHHSAQKAADKTAR
ncbi:MAG TPA: hypothetical protein VGL50_03565 [Steroidobacteraceae bacterium]|jgi:hypothetical protein